MSRQFLRATAVPLAVFALVGGVFALFKPGIMRSVLMSPRALLITAGVLLVTVGVTYAALRATRRGWLAVAAGLLPVVAFLTYTIAPAYRDVVVNDAGVELPADLDTGSLSEPPAGGAVGTPAAAAPTGTPARTPGTTGAPKPQALGRGTFTGIDHRASGTAYLLRDPSSGALSVVLAKLDVEPGPDYEVHLVPGHGTTRPTGIRLAHLKGNRGTQAYPVPAGTATDRPLSVLIWCRPFAVPVAVAPLG